MVNSQLKAACAAACLMGAWGTAFAQETVISGYVNGQSPMGPSQFLYEFNNSGSLSVGEHPLGLIPPVQTPFSFGVSGLDTGAYSFMADYLNPVGVPGVVVALNPNFALTVLTGNHGLGQTWIQTFGGTYAEQTIYTELLTGIYSGTAASLFSSLYTSGDFATYGQQSILVGFSNGNLQGVMLGQTPEPAPWCIVGFGALALVRRRNRA